MSFDVDLSKFRIEQYPDYRPGQPPDLLKLHEASYLDEVEQTWGRQWGAMGIGKLREVALSKPLEWEIDPFFTQDPDFFLLRYQRGLNLDEMRRSHDTYAELLTRHGVGIQWMEYPGSDWDLRADAQALRDRGGAVHQGRRDHPPIRSRFVQAWAGARVRQVRLTHRLPDSAHGAWRGDLRGGADVRALDR